MGVYYKFVNEQTKERIELCDVGPGSVKIGATCLGPASHLFTYLHAMAGPSCAWRIVPDTDDYFYDVEKEGPRYLADATERYVAAFNAYFTHQRIAYKGRATPEPSIPTEEK